MSVIGVVAEYNPFHFGHEHHLTETVRSLGEDCPVVCVMSGDFIQRGQAAVCLSFPCRGRCPRPRALPAAQWGF